MVTTSIKFLFIFLFLRLFLEKFIQTRSMSCLFICSVIMCGLYVQMLSRYTSTDYREVMSFDLCGDCYRTSSKHSGWFNQQRISNQANTTQHIRNILKRLIIEQPNNNEGNQNDKWSMDTDTTWTLTHQHR